MVVLHIHRDIYPKSDHGYTWVECLWFERDGRPISPMIPMGGYCERLGDLPGGPLVYDFVTAREQYAPDGFNRLEKTETIHDDDFFRIGPVCIVPTWR